MAEPTRYKRVSDVPSRIVTVPAGQAQRDTWTVKTPDGRYYPFYSAEDAQNFIDKNYPNHYMTQGDFGQTPPEGSDIPYVQELPEVTVVGQRPTPQPTQSATTTPTRRGIDMYISRNYSPRFNKAYNELGTNPLKWPERGGLLSGGGNASYWDSNTHQAVRQGGDIAAGVVATPFAAYATPQLMPLAIQSLKWRYTTPSGWVLGGAAELPQLAQAAEQNGSQDQQDNRSRLERVWDYAWDNPGKTFITLAGLQTAYNWANKKWGSAPEWKHGEAPKESGSLVPYDEKYAKGVKSLPRRIGTSVRNFAKQNWLSVPAGIYGAWQFGDWLLSSPNDQKGSQNTEPQDSTTTLPEGFRPIKAYNDQTGQVLVPGARGSDSIITIEPITRNRFGRGENQGE